MSSKWLCCIGVAIGVVSFELGPRRLSAKDQPNSQEKLLFLLDQVQSHSEQLKSGECTIAGRMYSPERPGKTILIDQEFKIRHTFVRPLKCRWEGRVPGWIVDIAQSGVDEKGNPTGGFKFDKLTVLFATNGPDAAYWNSDQLKHWISLWPRSTAEEQLDRTLYFPDIAYLPLYTAFPRSKRIRPDEIIDVLKKQPNVGIDESGPVWKVHWTIPIKKPRHDVVTVMDVDTENGFTVTKFANIIRVPSGKEKVQEQLTVKWEHQNGAYVPSHYTTLLGTKESGNYTSTEADITWLTVNAPLPDSLFEWGSFKVPQGTRVLDARHEPPIFTGEVAGDTNPNQVIWSRGRKWQLIGAMTFGAVLIGIYLGKRYFRRRSMPA